MAVVADGSFTLQDKDGVTWSYGARTLYGQTAIWAQVGAFRGEVDDAEGWGWMPVTSTKKVFADGFSGAALDTTNLWDVITDTGTMTKTVSGGTLTVAMNTTNAAELILRSKKAFALPADVSVAMSLSQRLAANDVRVSLIEVDPVTLAAVAHATISGDYQNRVSAYFGNTTTVGAASLETINESSAVMSSASTSFASTVTGFETILEARPQDVTLGYRLWDATGSKNGLLRLSRQVPNPNKLYKLELRFKNTSAPGSNTNVVIYRVTVADIALIQAEVTGRALISNSQATPVIIQSSNQIAMYPLASPSTAQTQDLKHKLIAASGTNATSVKNGVARLLGGHVFNAAATVRYLKFYNKASAPTVGTDVPVLTIALPAAGQTYIAEIVSSYGAYFTTGLAYALTTGSADADTGALTAGDVILNLIYV